MEGRAGVRPAVPVADEATGLPLIMLPAGFRYVSYGWTRDPMDDGIPTPPAHDGMAVVDAGHSRLVLVRNHEVRGRAAAYTPNRAITYDQNAGGGTTNLAFDPQRGAWLESWSSLAGTTTNCAGGATYNKPWLTCEETLDVHDLPHGYVFEMPAAKQAAPVPLRAMGRFVHEAVAIDRQTGHVYEAEDRGTAGLYRFVPKDKNRLDRGGRLQMLKVANRFQADLRGSVGVGTEYGVDWVDIADPERAHSPGTSDSLGVFRQGFDQGGAMFTRLEGASYGRRHRAGGPGVGVRPARRGPAAHVRVDRG